MLIAARVEVKELDARADMEQLGPLFLTQDESFLQPYLEIAAPARIREFLAGRMIAQLRRPEAFGFCALEDGAVQGVACLSELPWDSRFFGFAAARLDYLLCAERASGVKEELLQMSLREARARSIRHLTARVPAGDLDTLNLLESSGFLTLDQIQTFSLRLTTAERHGSETAIPARLFEAEDLPQILAIARRAYVYDRFHADTSIPPSVADAINEEWLRNSCTGGAADAVVVAANGSEVMGYATCKVNAHSGAELGVTLGAIIMVATTEQARNRGAASACTAAALRWLQEQGVKMVQVGTQARNIPAARLYEKCGFRLAANSITLRKLL